MHDELYFPFDFIRMWFLFIYNNLNGICFDQIEAIMNDFIQLKPHSNVYESETMIEG